MQARNNSKEFTYINPFNYFMRWILFLVYGRKFISLSKVT